MSEQSEKQSKQSKVLCDTATTALDLAKTIESKNPDCLLLPALRTGAQRILDRSGGKCEEGAVPSLYAAMLALFEVGIMACADAGITEEASEFAAQGIKLLKDAGMTEEAANLETERAKLLQRKDSE